jgi:mannose-6-phosphate isomerase-like protein (cupin superfamily)
MRPQSRTLRAAVIASVVLSGAACARAPHIITPETPAVDNRLTDFLAAHPLPVGQNISALPLGRTDALSYHLVQIRDREQPHVHATHDLVVTLLRGSGQLYVRDEPQPMRCGDVAVVPRGTPHHFVNTGRAPAAAFVTFAPPYDGADQVPVAAGP